MNFRVMSAVAWKLQELNSGRKSGQSNYRGLKLDENNPTVQSALSKIEEYNKLMTRREACHVTDVFGRKGAEHIREFTLNYKPEEDNDESDSSTSDEEGGQ